MGVKLLGAALIAAAAFAASTASHNGHQADLASSGTCRTFVGDTTITQCVPAVSPSGAVMSGQVEEDGAAEYADGRVFDPETSTFR